MSVLDWPRINFRGIFRCNPATTNNDDVLPDLVNRDSNTLGDKYAAMDDTTLREWIRRGVDMADYDTEPCDDTNPDNCRDRRCIHFVNSGWNLYGDHFTNFDDASVRSFVEADGTVVSDPGADPLIGVGIRLLGSKGDGRSRRAQPMMCDLDPTGLVTTQVYTGGLELTLDGQTILSIDHDTRCFQDWLNFMSTVAPPGQSYMGEQNFVSIGCMFQFVIPASVIRAQVRDTSPALARFLARVHAADGLVVRFRVYEVEPAIIDELLTAAFRKGQALENPGYGYLVGTLGVWNAEEPETEPAGRKLVCPYPRPAMRYADPDDHSRAHDVPAADHAWAGPPALIGNVVAKVRRTPAVISLDLVGAFPKYGFRHPAGPPPSTDPFPPPGFDVPRRKAWVGALELAVIPAGGDVSQAFRIGDIDYGADDFDTYQDQGGLFDLHYPSGLFPLIQSGTLIIRGRADSDINAGVPLVQEATIRVVTDDRGVYVEPDQPRHVRLKVYERGGPITAPVTLHLREYMNIIEYRDGCCCPDGFRPNQTTAIRPAQEHRLAFPPTVTIAPGAGYRDWVQVPIRPLSGGAALLCYQLSDYEIGNSVPAWSTQNYSSIRAYPRDQHIRDAIAAGDLDWDFVYEQALRYYYVLFPRMSTIIPLNEPTSILRYAAAITSRMHTPSDPDFYTTLNMPVTRTMSPARIDLIKAWIAEQQAAGDPT